MKNNKLSILLRGIIAENPVLILILGTCPTLATTTSVVNALGMGISAMIVLVCSNIVISALRKIIPSKVRIPAYVVIIASFVTIVFMVVEFTKDLKGIKKIPKKVFFSSFFENLSFDSISNKRASALLIASRTPWRVIPSFSAIPDRTVFSRSLLC